MKKYNLRCNYCGKSTPQNYIFLFLKLLLKKDYYNKCNNCHHLSHYKLIGHVAHAVNSKEQRFNMDLNDRQKEIWRSC